MMQFCSPRMAAYNGTAIPRSRFLSACATMSSVTPSATHQSSLTNSHETFVHGTSSDHVTQAHDFYNKPMSILFPLWLETIKGVLNQTQIMTLLKTLWLYSFVTSSRYMESMIF